MFGLKNGDLAAIIAIIAKYGEVEKAYIFGSRAKGNYKNGSDVDIALKGEKITFQTISGISYELNEETLMPYHFDVLNYHALDNRELISHIDRVGICFYDQMSNYDFNGLDVGRVSEEKITGYPDTSGLDKDKHPGSKR